MDKKRWKRYEISEARQKALFDQRAGEDPYEMIARQLSMANTFELAWLTLSREDEKQRQAVQVVQQAKTVFWTRLAVVFAALSLPASLLVALVAS